MTGLEIEKKVSQVYTKLNDIKNYSIFKKSSDERLDLYNEIKRIKEENEKRRLEEKEANTKADDKK